MSSQNLLVNAKHFEQLPSKFCSWTHEQFLKKNGFFTTYPPFFCKSSKNKRNRRGPFFGRLSNFELKLKKNEANMSSQNLLVNSKHFEQLPSKFWSWTHEQFLKKNGFLTTYPPFFSKSSKNKRIRRGPFFGRLSNFELKLKQHEANMSSQNLLVNSKHFEQLPSKFWSWTHEQFLKKNGFLTTYPPFFCKSSKNKRNRRGPFFGRLSNFELKLKKNEANMSSQNLLVNSKHFEQLPSNFWSWTHEQFLKKNGFLTTYPPFFWKSSKNKRIRRGPFFGRLSNFELKLKKNEANMSSQNLLVNSKHFEQLPSKFWSWTHEQFLKKKWIFYNLPSIFL